MRDKNLIESKKCVDHLANERTFLAWVRTSIGLMAFGFVIEKFAFFLKRLANFFGDENVGISSQFYSSFFGVSIIALGAIIGILAYFSFKKTEKRIEENTYKSSLFLPAVLTILVVVLGIILSYYLVVS